MAKFLTWLVLAAWLLPATGGADETLAKGKLLVATEVIGGDIFVRTVILLLHYDKTGAAGLVVNRPTEVRPEELLPDDEFSDYDGAIYWGGPVQMNSIRALLRTDKPSGLAEKIIGSVYLVPFDDALKDAIRDASRVRLFIGYAGWAPGQLDHELARGSWHVMPASDDVVFAKDPGTIWKRLVPAKDLRTATDPW